MVYSVDNTDLIKHSIGNVVAYHGRESIAGVALGYRIMELAQLKMFEQGYPVRGKIAVETSFSGKGVSDAFEAVYRTGLHNLYKIDNALGKGLSPAPDKGDFYFKITQGGAHITIVAKEGIFPQRYYDLMDKVRAGTLSSDEYAEVREIRENGYTNVMNAKLDNLFNVTSLVPFTEKVECKPIEFGKGDETIPVKTKEAVLNISYEDLIHYHGTRAICGATLIYRLFTQVTGSGEVELERGVTKMTQGVIGDGIRDVSNMVLRGGITLDRAFGARYSRAPAPGGFANGAFVYALEDKGGKHVYVLKDAMYPARYFELAGKAHNTPLSDAEMKEKREVQLKFAADLLANKEPFHKLV